MRDSGLVAAAGCLWLVSALLLLPLVWFGLSYGYTVAEWLSLLPFPAEDEEVLPWFLRTLPLLGLMGSTAFLVVSAFRKDVPTDRQ